MEARAERMRAAKQAHLEETHESRGWDDQQTCGSDSGNDNQAGPSSFMPRDTPEYDDDGPQWSESENDRGSESLSSESNFEDKKVNQSSTIGW